MEPNKQDAASNLPTPADFEAYLQAMQLGFVGDTSSSQQQTHHRAGASPTPLNPPQLLARPTAPVARPHESLVLPQASMYGDVEFFLADRTRRLAHGSWRLQSPSQASSYGDVGELSTADDIRRLAYGSPLMNAPAARTPSMAPRWSNLSASAEEFRPISLSHLSGVQSPSTEIPSTSQNGNDSLDPATSDLLRRARAHPALLMSAEFSVRVVNLLAEGDDTVRQRVFKIARGVVHQLMRNREGYDVFVALLRACNASPGRSEELKDIIYAVCIGKGNLTSVVQDDLGEKALKELIEVVAGERYLCLRLIRQLFDEGVIEESSKGHELLRHCFVALPYDREIITQLALADIDKLLSSTFGWECLEMCLMYADDNLREVLEDNIVRRTSVIAKDRDSYRLLCHVLRLHGNEQLKVRIAERVRANIVELSVHKWGHFVVEACIFRPAPPQALWLVLSAFRDLHNDVLEELVLDFHSSYVVVKLLTQGKRAFPQIAVALAMRIFELPALLQREENTDRVERAIIRLFMR